MLYIDKLDLSDLQFNIVKSKQCQYINIELGFDIETSNTIVCDNKFAFMYEFTLGIHDNNHIYYGRTWEEFITACKYLQTYFDLSEDRRIIIYIHNMSFEFQFMRKYFSWLDVFAVDERQPIKALCEYGIEFRDSLILSGMSLAKTAENLTSHTIKKLVGDLDYKLIRTSSTPLSDEELAYCNNDVEILLYYINEQIAQYGDITKIPLTNTGRVRQFVKNNCFYGKSGKHTKSKGRFYRYREMMSNLTIADLNEYNELKRAFQGGYTHANSYYVGKVINDVNSIDFTSSYPTVMLSELFPMSSGIRCKVNSYDELKELCNHYCVIFDVMFTNLQPKFFDDFYISKSKCWNVINSIESNGRIVSAESLCTTITNVDLIIISNCYKWDSIAVANVIKYVKGYLPKSIIESILELYGKKTQLKNVSGKEAEYLLSKGMLNSVYGMCVTDIIRDTIQYVNDDYKWNTEQGNYTEQLDKYNKGMMRFLYYPWGVFVTAYARKNLWQGIFSIADDYIYSDTDSIKFINYDKHKEYIDNYNTQVKTKLYKMCEWYGIDSSLLCPKTIQGKEKFIGVWDYEGCYSRFKTLGAKRYLVEKEGKMTLTCAGLSKRNGIDYMSEMCYNDNSNVFDMFNNDLYIPPDRTGKLCHTYIDDENTYTMTDYKGNTSEVTSKSYVHLSDEDFTLSLSKQFTSFLEHLRKGELFKGTVEKAIN